MLRLYFFFCVPASFAFKASRFSRIFTTFLCRRLSRALSPLIKDIPNSLLMQYKCILHPSMWNRPPSAGCLVRFCGERFSELTRSPSKPPKHPAEGGRFHVGRRLSFYHIHVVFPRLCECLCDFEKCLRRV